MEDAHITASPLADKKNSLFAVFDGHGGIQHIRQAPRYQPMLRGISYLSFNQIKTTRTKIMKKP